MVTAKEAGEQLRAKNKKTISPIPKNLVKSVPPIHIFNVGKKTHSVGLGSLGQFYIPAKEEGQRYSKPLILPGIMFDGVAREMTHIELQMQDGNEVAQDVIGKGPFKNASQNLERVGVFISAGPVPSEEELLAAEEKVRQENIRLVKDADDLYAQGPLQIVNISADHREACVALNQTREWAKMPTQMINCPSCNEPVNPSGARCGGRYGCGFIYNRARAIELGIPVDAEIAEDAEEVTAPKGRAKRA